MTNLDEWIAYEIFITDGGVDDFEEMPDEELSRIVKQQLTTWANDATWVRAIVDAAKTMGVR